MKDLKAEVAYLQGLAKGLEVDDQSKAGRIIQGLIDVLGKMADSLEELWDAQEQMEDYLESIDEDLYLLENGGYKERRKPSISQVEMTCPNCRERVSFDSDLMDEDEVIEVTCPTCEQVVYTNDGPSEYRDDGGGKNETAVFDHPATTQDI